MNFSKRTDWRQTIRDATGFFAIVAAGVFTLGIQSVSAQSELPDLCAASFSAPLRIDNPFLLLSPGQSSTHESQTTDPETGLTEIETAVKNVLKKKRTIAGIKTRGVRERVFSLEGLLSEDVVGWHAQDDEGNVWLLAEDVTLYERDDSGNVIEILHEDTWEAGVDGALPGQIMKAEPMVGQSYFHKFIPGQAEDEATVIALGDSVSVQGRIFSNVLQVKETSVLSPDATALSYYALGIGDVLSLDFDEDGSISRSALISGSVLSRCEIEDNDEIEDDD